MKFCFWFFYVVFDIKRRHGLRVFENRVLRRIFGPKRDGIRGNWSKLHNEELHNLNSSRNIIRMIKSRREKRADHIARGGVEKYIQGCGKKDLDVVGSIILKLMSE
jgi:hypothetical protein